jgi:asparagine synthase (glutamine-hydrolysing)
MCGIAGFAGAWPPGSIHKALDAMRLRGPDGAFTRQLPELQLGAVRLAIMDPEHGEQPFADNTGDCLCFAAGEIYNAPELREALCARGARFRTRCDLEVIPHAWSHWGAASIRRLQGMFAVALWHQREQCLYLFRDATGQKPLYWTRQAGGFAFASEIRGLSAAGIALHVDTKHLAAYLALRYLPGPQTAFSGVQSLAPGHLLSLQTGQPPTITRWDSVADATGADLRTDLADLARQAVQHACRADVPVGIYLSGGIDSAYLAHTAAAHGLQGPALTLTFEHALDEADQAGKVARAVGLHHHRVPWHSTALERLPELVARLENPVGDVIIVALDLLAERAADLGVRVVLSGEGPDEWFCGYGFHRAHLWAKRLSAVPGLLRLLAAGMPLAGALASSFAGLEQALGREELQRIAAWLRGWPSARARERSDGLRRLFTPSDLRGLVNPERYAEWNRDLAELEPLSSDDLATILATQCQGWLPGWVAGRHEKIAMARGIEVRMPLLDRTLRDYAHRLPDSQRCNGWRDKIAWRNMLSAQGLGDTARPKQAFSPPAVATVRSPTFAELDVGYLSADALRRRGWFDVNGVESLRQRARAGSLLAAKQWSAVLILEIWAQHYRVGH